ncbi:hypothetical protein EDEG_00890 [Edhazardia aedis USNM 41457]|uniref:Uncharacterized protein n=1 Tax=Edhazardia aedis (strain USNM 41457) TaxID=1003232 RepID=J9DR04_EDHAE|nr:hypothetical protein EDEG_00890 [Edhazardia aedis USNM 41457]|eukprot:EJW05010.1 hypothetical protein EDEG_00890 [Edhazardia aedis USNM 41457]
MLVLQFVLKLQTIYSLASGSIGSNNNALAYTSCNIRRAKKTEEMMFDILEIFVMNFLEKEGIKLKDETENAKYSQFQFSNDYIIKKILDYIVVFFKNKNIINLSETDSICRLKDENQITEEHSTSYSLDKHSYMLQLEYLASFMRFDDFKKKCFLKLLHIKSQKSFLNDERSMKILYYFESVLNIQSFVYLQDFLSYFRLDYIKKCEYLQLKRIDLDFLLNKNDLIEILKQLVSTYISIAIKQTVNFRLCKELFVYNWICKNVVANKSSKTRQIMFLNLVEKKLTTLKNIINKEIEKSKIRSKLGFFPVNENLTEEIYKPQISSTSRKDYKSVLTEDNKCMNNSESSFKTQNSGSNINMNENNQETSSFSMKIKNIKFEMYISIHEHCKLKDEHFNTLDLANVGVNELYKSDEFKAKIVSFCEKEKQIIYELLIVQFFSSLRQLFPKYCYIFQFTRDYNGLVIFALALNS